MCQVQDVHSRRNTDCRAVVEVCCSGAQLRIWIADHRQLCGKIELEGGSRSASVASGLGVRGHHVPIISYSANTFETLIVRRGYKHINEVSNRSYNTSFSAMIPGLPRVPHSCEDAIRQIVKPG